MPFLRRLRTAAIPAILLLPALAHAQIDDTRHQQDWEQCTGSSGREAIDACKTLIDSHIDPPDKLAVAYSSRGAALYLQGKADLALADFSNAIRLRANYATALHNRGTLYAARHAYDLAIADFTQALHAPPGPDFDPTITLSSRASVYATQGDDEHAIADFNDLIQRKPKDADALFRRANIYTRQGDLTRALQDYDRSLALNPTAPAVVDARNRVAQRAGVIAPPASSATPSMPICAVLPATSPKAQPSYVDDAVDHLRKIIPELHGLQPDPADLAQTTSILNQTAAAIATMLPKIPNLVAREEVQRAVTVNAAVRTNQVPLGGGRGRSGGSASLNTNDYESSSHTVTTTYTYRIVRRGEHPTGEDLDELRTDAKNRPLSAADDAKNVGFGALWLLFAPANLQQAHFRYLGRQKITGHETFVLSFAQIPGVTLLSTVVGPEYARCNTFIQGIAWIDQSTFHIIRMQTDLLAPIPDIQIAKIRSILKYAEVKIPERALSLWLPADVTISWSQGTQDDSETHRYSKYRLYAGTARITETVEGSAP